MALAAVAVLVAFQYLGLRAARSLGIVPVPDRFTELYFVAPTSLPRSLSTADPLLFAFVVSNHEGAARAYHWSVRSSSQQPGGLLASGTLDLPAGASGTVPVDVVAPDTRGATTVTVRLDPPPESIDFHVVLTGPRT